MEIRVLNRYEFNKLMNDNHIDDETVESYKNVFFISINDTSSSQHYKRSWFDHDHENVKVLYFDDVESENETSPTNSGKCLPFSEAMAHDLYDFMKRNMRKEQCIIHCHAGISRSGAISCILADMVGVSFEKLKRDNPRICPNGRVMRLLNQAIRDDFSSNVE